MANFLPALCYHPTTIVFIDDNQNFLQNVRLELDCTKAVYRFFNDPLAALKMLESYQIDQLFSFCTERDLEEEAPDRPIVKIDLRKIHHKSHDPRRFEQISTLVIDYAMPQLNGLELCKKLHHLPYKKIMLTCEADEKLAVQAFNEGLIDSFVRKDTPNFSIVINNAIRDMQIKYFQDSSQPIANYLRKTEYQSLFLYDLAFKNFFDQTYNSLQATEYYLMDNSGSFMFLDINAIPSWLAVKNSTDMHACAEFAAFDKTPPEITLALKKRTQIPYFHTDQELDNTSAPDWGHFMHPAQELDGSLDIYSYAIITDPKKYKIGKVLSFAKYCEKNN